MGKKKPSDEAQSAAYEAHLRGKAALDKGDIAAAIAADDKSADQALAAMLRRLQGE